MNLCDINIIKAVLNRHGFRFSKKMGQNFLIEGWVPQETAEASGAGPGVGVVEIGPGIGCLTKELSKRAEKVASVEIDRRLLPVLAETMPRPENVDIFLGDVQEMDLADLCRTWLPDLRWAVCANLPYNITTPVITQMIEANCFESITVMIQKEVAQRICALPGNPDYGAFSVFCQYHADCALLFDVPPECFYPAPKVTSAVIRMDLREEPPVEVEDKDFFFRVVKASFAQRRKTLLNGLYAGFGGQYSKAALHRMITVCGLPEDVRGERLGISEFAALAKLLKKNA